jgi:hypothetical protein
LNAPAIAPDRARIDALLAELVADLRGAHLHTCADSIEEPDDDVARALALREHSDCVPVVDRQIYLRTATPWVARALEARAAGDQDEALRWADRAAAELERYRDIQRGDGL